MQNTVFQHLIKGHSIPLTDTELSQFEIYCSHQNISLQKWISISLLLFKQKKQHCLHFLQYIQKNQLSKSIFNDYIHQDNKIKIFSYLFAMTFTKANKQKSKPQSTKLISEANQYLISSERVNNTNNIICRAFLQYYNGDFTKATNSLNKQIQIADKKINDSQNNDNKFIGLIGLAQINFLKKNYEKALYYYKKVLSTYKSLPIKARIGMAYSFFYLQKYQMAKACFNRILQLSSDCVEAYIGLAIIQDKNQNYVEYFRYLSKAAKVNRQHPLVLLHLSEHFLIKGNLQKAMTYALEGLNQIQNISKLLLKNQDDSNRSFRNDYQELKARFNNILGQVQHIKNNFVQALKYYRLASQKGLIFNQIYLSQIYTHPLCQDYMKSLQILQSLFSRSKQQTRFLNDSLKDIGYLKSKVGPKAQDNKSSQEYYNEAIVYNQKQIQTKIQLSNQIIQTKKQRALRLMLSAHRILQTQSNLIRPQLLNNIGVLYLQNKQYNQSLCFLTQCTNKLRKTKQVSNNIISQSDQIIQQNQLKTQSHLLIALFNLGIIKQKLCLFTQCISIYKQIIQQNKYFIDAHIRLAYVYYQLGNFKQSIDILEQGLKQQQNQKTKMIRFDKIFSMKASILKQYGNHGQARAVLKSLGKTRDIYTQIQQTSMIYQSLLKRQVQISTLKQFLRPNRQMYMKYCHQDHNSAFGYLVLCVMLLTDKRISLKQGNQLFNQLRQHSSEDIIIILYNMGLFFINYDQYEKAKSILVTYKEKNNDQRAEQLMGLANFLQAKYDNAILNAKKNILLNPVNIKSRYQLILASEKKCQSQRHDDKNKNNKNNLLRHLQTLKKCFKFYTFFSKINLNDYVKYYDSPDFKDNLKNNIQKIRSISQQRKFYVSSNIDYSEKIFKDLQMKFRQQEQIKKRNLLKLKQNQQISKQNHYQQLLQNDSQDSQQIRKRKRQDKKRKALELARLKQSQLHEKFQQFKQKQRQMNEKKKTRQKQPRQKGKKRQKKQQKNSDSQGQVSYDSVKSDQQRSVDSPSLASLQNQDDIQAPKRKRRQQIHKQRRQKKKIKKQRQSYNLSDDQFSENPFDNSGDEKSQKKQKDKENDDNDDGIDMGAYML